MSDAFGGRSHRVDQIIERLHQLKEIRRQLANQPMSPPGAWIHEYEVKKQYRKGGDVYVYCYAKSQADTPIFRRNSKAKLRGVAKGKNPEFTCHQHIGRVWSSTGLGIDPDVAIALKEWERRKQLDAIDKALEQVEAALIEVMPQKK